MTESTLYDAKGRRLFLTEEEREDFIRVAFKARPEIRTFCGLLHYTGCRLAEAVELTPQQVDLSGGIVFGAAEGSAARTVPVPPDFLEDLDQVHGIGEAQRSGDDRRNQRLWPETRRIPWLRVKEVCADAGILEGPHACPNGIRHGFGVHAVRCGVPLPILRNWLGHRQIGSTAIYTTVLEGAEDEATAASRMWERSALSNPRGRLPSSTVSRPTGALPTGSPAGKPARRLRGQGKLPPDPENRAALAILRDIVDHCLSKDMPLSPVHAALAQLAESTDPHPAFKQFKDALTIEEPERRQQTLQAAYNAIRRNLRASELETDPARANQDQNP